MRGDRNGRVRQLPIEQLFAQHKDAFADGLLPHEDPGGGGMTQVVDETLYLWQFVRARSGTRECWRWRVTDAQRTIGESSSFPLFLECVANAREYGFDIASDTFDVIEE